MSLYLCRCRNPGMSHITSAFSRTSVRYLSSKKSDSKPEDPHATAPPKKQALAKMSKDKKTTTKAEAASGKSGIKRFTQNYIAFKDLPKPSPEFQEMSTEQFNALLHMTNLPEQTVPKHEELMPFSGFKYEFHLHPKHRLPSRRVPAETVKRGFNAIEPNLSLLGISMDADTLSSGLEEHPLRESITGMCVMNPLLKEIKNKSLWEFFPESRKYGSSPFGEDASFNAFKNWEDLKNAKLKVFEEKKKQEEKEFRDFCSNLLKSDSFYRRSGPPKSDNKKPAPVAASTKTVLPKETPVVTNGRRKLDRGLMKQYRKYKKEQLFDESKDENEDD